jgi:hypothetical protein
VRHGAAAADAYGEEGDKDPGTPREEVPTFRSEQEETPLSVVWLSKSR